MKNILLLLVIVFFSAVTSYGQKEKLNKNVDITAGYIPNSTYSGLKGGVSVNNIMVKRFGLYTSFEYGLGDKDYFTNIIGATGSITNYLYVFAGVDVYSKHGLVSNDSFSRKEMGIGVLPFKWAAVRIGYSFSVGPTIAVGFRFNIYDY